MFVCGWDTLKLKGGRIARRGDPVPEAAEWDESIRRANLRIGSIILVPDKLENKTHQKASEAVKVSGPKTESISDKTPDQPKLAQTHDKGRSQKKKRN